MPDEESLLTPAMTAQIPEEPFCPFQSLIFLAQNGQYRSSPLHEDNVAVPVREHSRSLVAIESNEPILLEQVGKLLAAPPGVVLGYVVGVIGDSQKIELGGIPGVARVTGNLKNATTGVTVTKRFIL